MSIYKSSVNKPITTMMLFTAIIVAGIYSLINIPVDLYPEIEPPFMSVITTYAGANAAEIEMNVTKQLEESLNSVNGLKEITSTSYDNFSTVSVEFEWGTDLNEANNDIRDVTDRIYDNLPDGCDRPMVLKFNTSMMPIMVYAITAKESYPGIEKLIEEKIINPLNRIDGLASIGMMGAPRRVIYVEADPRKLDAYHLTVEQIGAVIASENLNMPSGNVKMGNTDYQLRIQGEFIGSEKLRQLVLGSYNGKSIYLTDVATVRDTLKDIALEERVNGEQGLRIYAMKQSGANTVKVTREIEQSLEAFSKELPPDVKIDLIMDTSTFIKGSINNLSQTLLWAFVFVVLVILAFLGRWRATFIIVLTIPISLIVSFIYLFATGNSINVISLTSLSIAIGMVVDDAIVVLENIIRHIERGSSPREAAIYATNEVWLAVIITTLVIMAVFLPLTLVGGMTGVMFNQLGWIVTITIVTSTLAAISLTPMLAAKLLRNRPVRENPSRFSWDRTFKPALDWLDNFYEKTLRWVLVHKKFTISVSMAIFLSSLILIKFIGTDFMPESDESRISVAIELESGTRVEETMKITRKLEQIIREKHPEVVILSSSSGADDEGGMFSMFNTSGSNIINLMMRLSEVEDRELSVWDITDAMRSDFAGIPEIVTAIFTTSGQMMGGTAKVEVEIFGYDFNATNLLAEQVKEKISSIKGAKDVIISRKKDKPELQISLDREKMALHGLNSAMVSANIRNRVSGLLASRYKEDGEEYDIRIRLEERYRNSISDLEQLSIMSPSGQILKLKEIGEVKEYWGPPSIQHKRKERLVTVSVSPDKVSLGTLAKNIKTSISAIPVPQDVMVNVGGTYEDQQESFRDLALLMVVSLILVFIVMASQFESFVMPFVIMFSIPFAFTGVLLALFFTGTTLTLVAGLGAVLLIGIVVKNGIVLIDFTNLMRDRGYELYEAIALAGKSRLRPVLMTAATTILGMLPLALSTGEGSELWKPMGITVIGGLVFSTIVTMVIVPVMYGVFARRGERNKVEKLRKQYRFMD